jgi:SOS response associated peptidase (SRAP)
MDCTGLLKPIGKILIVDRSISKRGRPSLSFPILRKYVDHRNPGPPASCGRPGSDYWLPVGRIHLPLPQLVTSYPPLAHFAKFASAQILTSFRGCAAAIVEQLKKKSLRGSITSRSQADRFADCYNIAPSQRVLTIRFNPETPARSLDALQWGLIPYWAKDPKIAYRTINARAPDSQ